MEIAKKAHLVTQKYFIFCNNVITSHKETFGKKLNKCTTSQSISTHNHQITEYNKNGNNHEFYQFNS